jgi:cyclopropane fatty-acyl-phospholipid synthase-like methyltransferase
MLLDSVRNLLGWRTPPSLVGGPAAEPQASASPPPQLPEDDDPVWPSARIGVAERLWGQGFVSPGGAEEALRLAKPLGLSPASSLLLLGAGSGGPALAVANTLGSWVSGYEENVRLAALANERSQRAGLAKRAQVAVWNPRAPQFALHYYHHAIAIEPLRGAAAPPTLGAVSLALKPGGQFVLVETVADRPLDATDPMVATWARLDHRPPEAPSELAISETLARLGFDVRIVEDVSQRHLHFAMAGWQEAVRAMTEARPSTREAALIVNEAELWMARFRLIRFGKLRLVRWHAIARTGAAPRA